jgi:hypothetical protein
MGIMFKLAAVLLDEIDMKYLVADANAAEIMWLAEVCVRELQKRELDVGLYGEDVLNE